MHCVQCTLEKQCTANHVIKCFLSATKPVLSISCALWHFGFCHNSTITFEGMAWPFSAVCLIHDFIFFNSISLCFQNLPFLIQSDPLSELIFPVDMDLAVSAVTCLTHVMQYVDRWMTFVFLEQRLNVIRIRNIDWFFLPLWIGVTGSPVWRL